jgi:hypothetical protein
VLGSQNYPRRRALNVTERPNNVSRFANFRPGALLPERRARPAIRMPQREILSVMESTAVLFSVPAGRIQLAAMTIAAASALTFSRSRMRGRLYDFLHPQNPLTRFRLCHDGQSWYFRDGG